LQDEQTRFLYHRGKKDLRIKNEPPFHFNPQVLALHRDSVMILLLKELLARICGSTLLQTEAFAIIVYQSVIWLCHAVT